MDTALSEEDELAKARLLLQKAEEERQAACAAELEAILNKYGYALIITPARIILTKANTQQGMP